MSPIRALVRNALCVLALSSVMSVAASAGDDFLSADKIRVLLSDRTVEGNQDGRKWRQTFSAGGATVYSEAGRADSPGRWSARSDDGGGLYCSLWPPSDRWDCYRMTQEGDTVSWVPLGGGDVWPGRLLAQ